MEGLSMHNEKKLIQSRMRILLLGKEDLTSTNACKTITAEHAFELHMSQLLYIIHTIARYNTRPAELDTSLAGTHKGVTLCR